MSQHTVPLQCGVENEMKYFIYIHLKSSSLSLQQDAEAGNTRFEMQETVKPLRCVVVLDGHVLAAPQVFR